jgi:hypothetical protein
MQTKYAVIEHYPDGNSGGCACPLFETEQEAQDYIARNHYDLCTVEKVQTITLQGE